MAGIPWSQQQKIAAAVSALQDWESRAVEVGVHVAQINLELVQEDPSRPVVQVIFEWDEELGEYAMRTT